MIYMYVRVLLNWHLHLRQDYLSVKPYKRLFYVNVHNALSLIARHSVNTLDRQSVS